MICKGCVSQCCFDPWEASLHEFKRITFSHPIPKPTRVLIDRDWVVVGTKDTPCPYLNLKTMKCSIYFHRPQHCRDLGTRRIPCTEMIRLKNEYDQKRSSPK